MRIGLLIYGSLEPLSGGYLYDRMLVRTLEAAGDEVRILSLPWRNYGRHLLDNASPRLWQRLRTLPVDVLLQDELNHPSLFLANRVAAPLPYPTIAIVHHLRADEDHPMWVRRLYRGIERAYLQSVDGFVFNSSTTRHRVTALAGPRRPGVVAWPAADHLPLPDRARTDRLLERRKRRGGRPLRLLAVGNVIRRKGIHVLLDALASIPREQWRLDVVGALASDPGYVAAIEQRIRRAGWQAQVRLRGRVSDADLVAHYEQADLFVLPSYEGFGIVYLEAMAFGLPVVGTTSGAAGETISHGQNGYLVAPEEPSDLAVRLRSMVANPGLLCQMGRAARRRFEAHPTWDDSAHAVRAFLQQVTGHAGNG